MMPFHKVLTVSLSDGQATKYPSSDPTLNGRTPEFGSDVKDRIEHRFCDSADLVFYEGCRIGFGLVDGSHTYDYVINDFNKMLPNLAHDGVIVFHDYSVGHPEIMRAVASLMKAHTELEWETFGVVAWCRKVFL
jgi:hypothetical protein